LFGELFPVATIPFQRIRDVPMSNEPLDPLAKIV
jgi:hypothetical protein